MSIHTLPDGRRMCVNGGHGHQLRADQFHCAFNQDWKRLAKEAGIERFEARRVGMEAASMTADEIEVGDSVRLGPGCYVEVTSKITDAIGMIHLGLADSTELSLAPHILRWVRYVESAA